MAKASRRRPLTLDDLKVKEKVENNVLISQVHAENKTLKGLPEDVIDSYQMASLYGNRIFDSSKWLLKSLPDGMPKPCRLLDVGCLKPSYTKIKWIQPTYIDLHPKHPSVRKADLLEYNDEAGFDVVCLALVLNFAGCYKARFQMLRKARFLLKEGGYLFVVLPRACMMNSRFMTVDYFEKLLQYVGFTGYVKSHLSNKLFFCLVKKTNLECSGTCPEQPNLVINGGNNFKIKP
mgnify:CR=1 FL=1